MTALDTVLEVQERCYCWHNSRSFWVVNLKKPGLGVKQEALDEKPSNCPTVSFFAAEQ